MNNPSQLLWSTRIDWHLFSIRQSSCWAMIYWPRRSWNPEPSRVIFTCRAASGVTRPILFIQFTRGRYGFAIIRLLWTRCLILHASNLPKWIDADRLSLADNENKYLIDSSLTGAAMAARHERYRSLLMCCYVCSHLYKLLHRRVPSVGSLRMQMSRASRFWDRRNRRFGPDETKSRPLSM